MLENAFVLPWKFARTCIGNRLETLKQRKDLNREMSDYISLIKPCIKIKELNTQNSRFLYAILIIVFK